MNCITFDYTKISGTTTKRVVYPLVVPNKMYEGIDVSELDFDDQTAFIVEMSRARDAYIAQMAEIQARFYVKKNYRRFDPAKMTHVIEEAI